MTITQNRNKDASNIDAVLLHNEYYIATILHRQSREANKTYIGKAVRFRTLFAKFRT